MTPLRNRMIEDLQLRGYSESTQSLYVNAVRQLCEHYDKSPGRITEEDLRDYFLYGKTLKNGPAALALSPYAASNFSMKIPLSVPGQRCCLSAPGMKRNFPSSSAMMRFVKL